MRLLKEEIVEMLRDNGDIGTAQRVESTFPNEVDTDDDGELLRREGVDVEYLLKRRTGSS